MDSRTETSLCTRMAAEFIFPLSPSFSCKNTRLNINHNILYSLAHDFPITNYLRIPVSSTDTSQLFNWSKHSLLKFHGHEHRSSALESILSQLKPFHITTYFSTIQIKLLSSVSLGLAKHSFCQGFKMRTCICFLSATCALLITIIILDELYKL